MAREEKLWQLGKIVEARINDKRWQEVEDKCLKDFYTYMLPDLLKARIRKYGEFEELAVDGNGKACRILRENGLIGADGKISERENPLLKKDAIIEKKTFVALPQPENKAASPQNKPSAQIEKYRNRLSMAGRS